MFKNMSPGAIGVSGTMQECLAIAKEVGFEGMDVNINEAARIAGEKSPRAIKDMFLEAGLKIGGCNIVPEFRKDEETFRKGLAELPEKAALAHDIEIKRTYTWIRPFSDELPFEQNFELHARRLTEIAQILDEHGLRFGLEFVGPKTSRAGHKYEFIYDMDGMLKLCEAIGTPNVGLLLDSWHWYTTGGTVEDIRRLRADQVVYVHVNDAPKGIPVDEQIDNVRCLPGETGVIDIKGFLQALKEIGYDGPVTPEPFKKELREMPPREAARTVAESMDKIWRIAGLS